MTNQIETEQNAQDTKIAMNTDGITTVSRNVLDSFQEFPTFPVLHDIWNSNALSRLYGGVTVAVSSILPNYFIAGGISATVAFDKVYGTQIGWISAKAFYSTAFTQWLNDDVLTIKTSPSTTENYTLYRTTVNGVRTGKQWISIDCGLAKTFVGFKLYFKDASSGNNFKDYHVAGSNNNVHFTSLYHETNENYSDGRIIARTLSYPSGTTYRYYRIVVNDIVDGGNGVNHHSNLQEWAFLQSFDLSGYAKTSAVTSVESSANAISTDLNKLVSLINKWVKSGNLSLNAIAYSSDPIREHW